MGNLHSMEYAEAVTTGTLKLEIALEQHLHYNHYPPVPLSMVKPCMKAIENANAGDWDKKVRLPEGITYKDKKFAPTSAIIEFNNLDWFLEEDEVIDNFPNEEELRKQGWK
jgi:hypothetical protein